MQFIVGSCLFFNIVFNLLLLVNLNKYQDDITKHQNQITASKEDFGEVIKEQSKE